MRKQGLSVWLSMLKKAYSLKSSKTLKGMITSPYSRLSFSKRERREVKTSPPSSKQIPLKHLTQRKGDQLSILIPYRNIL